MSPPPLITHVTGTHLLTLSTRVIFLTNKSLKTTNKFLRSVLVSEHPHV